MSAVTLVVQRRILTLVYVSNFLSIAHTARSSTTATSTRLKYPENDSRTNSSGPESGTATCSQPRMIWHTSTCGVCVAVPWKSSVVLCKIGKAVRLFIETPSLLCLLSFLIKDAKLLLGSSRTMLRQGSNFQLEYSTGICLVPGDVIDTDTPKALSHAKAWAPTKI